MAFRPRKSCISSGKKIEKTKTVTGKRGEASAHEIVH